MRFLKINFVTAGVLFKTVSASQHMSRSLVFIGVCTETGTEFPKVVPIMTPSSCGTILLSSGHFHVRWFVSIWKAFLQLLLVLCSWCGWSESW